MVGCCQILTIPFWKKWVLRHSSGFSRFYTRSLLGIFQVVERWYCWNTIYTSVPPPDPEQLQGTSWVWYILLDYLCCSVIKFELWLSAECGLQHTRLPYPLLPLEFAQTHAHQVSDAIQPSHPLSSPSPALSLSQHQGLFQWVGSLTSGGQSIGASALASVLPMNIQGWFPLGLTGLIYLQPKGFSRVFSSTTVQKYSSLVFSLLYDLTLTSIHDYWKNHSFDCLDLCQQSDVSAA